MIWLATQMWTLLVLSLALGLLVGWWIWNRPLRHDEGDTEKELAQLRSRIEESDAEKNKLRSQLLEFETERAHNAPPLIDDQAELLFYDSPTDGDPDNLKKIKGIGPQLEKTLNEMGVYYFHQIASWTDGQIERIDDRLRFKGRIARDGWRGQASTFAANRQDQLPLN